MPWNQHLSLRCSSMEVGTWAWKWTKIVATWAWQCTVVQQPAELWPCGLIMSVDTLILSLHKNETKKNGAECVPNHCTCITVSKAPLKCLLVAYESLELTLMLEEDTCGCCLFNVIVHSGAATRWLWPCGLFTWLNSFGNT